MKFIKNIFIIIISLVLGFIIGWRATVLNGIVSVDETNEHIGYFECWGQVDEYYMD